MSLFSTYVSSTSVHHQEHFVQAVFADLVCGTTVRTTRHVQPLRSCSCVFCWTAYMYYKMIHGPYRIKLKFINFYTKLNAHICYKP